MRSYQPLADNLLTLAVTIASGMSTITAPDESKEIVPTGVIVSLDIFIWGIKVIFAMLKRNEEEINFENDEDIINQAFLDEDLIINQVFLPEEKPILEIIPLNSLEEKLEIISYSSEKLPINLCCPISHSIMNDPVIAYDGHTYNRPEIEAWLRTNKRSPIENTPLENITLIPNKDKKSETHEFVQMAQRKYYSVVKNVFFKSVIEQKSKEETIEKITNLVKGYLS